MSRVGKLPVPVPSGVEVVVQGRRVTVRGPKGSLSLDLHARVDVVRDEGCLRVTRAGDEREARALHGLTRKLLANMVTGVKEGFTRVLEINGVGYRAEVRGGEIHLTLGHSHPVVFPLPPGVQARVDRQVVITLEGADCALLGRTAAMLRSLRPPEPYKGKGIRYAGEAVRRKAGKAAGAGGGA